MLKRLIEVALPLKDVSEQSARERSRTQPHSCSRRDWWMWNRVTASCAADFTLKLEGVAKTNPNVRLVEYAIRLDLSPKG